MSLHNPFLWHQNPRPSIFLKDGDSATRSRRASQTVDRITASTGKNPGTLTGIGKDSRSSPIPDAWANKARGVR